MKYVDAIYASEKMIQRLWFIVALLGFFLAALLGITIYYSTKAPLIIERSCETKTLATGSNKKTSAEIQAFISDAISARFDSDRDKPSLLTEAQADLKQKELKELRSRKIDQRVFVDEITVNGDGTFTAKLTRLLKVENIRTALGFSIEAKIFEDTRTEDNPYGLVLSEVKLLNSEVKK
jgi:hypothetical protein